MTRPSVASAMSIGQDLGLPRLHRRLVHRVEPVRRGLVRPEQPEVARVGVGAEDVAQVLAEHTGRLRHAARVPTTFTA